ncbi:uncharacterized protein LOC116844831 [Odontomachus brunneus]|uniref:uncharacterized protein LOC116844831 n=1 Tax=Odontomachus brunneus TaxID=486640 RepID=UPI0013F241FE|nr:uncharacterized protein LOC116844831 [Odontomachus brunneus]
MEYREQPKTECCNKKPRIKNVGIRAAIFLDESNHLLFVLNSSITVERLHNQNIGLEDGHVYFYLADFFKCFHSASSWQATRTHGLRVSSLVSIALFNTCSFE